MKVLIFLVLGVMNKKLVIDKKGEEYLRRMRLRDKAYVSGGVGNKVR